MSEIMKENFEEMLESQCLTLNTGDVVTGTVTHVSDAELQLDVGVGVTGYIKAVRGSDDPSVKLTEQFKVGDTVEAKVVRVSDIEGVAELSKKRVDSDKNWTGIVAAYENGDILEGKQTYLMVQAMSRANDEQREVLRSTHKRKDIGDDEKIAIVKALYDVLDVKHSTEQQIEIRFERALAILDTLSIAGERTKHLEEFARGLMGRKK